jgi:hypothetical protein
MLLAPKRPYQMPLAEFIPVRLVAIAIFNEIYGKTEHQDLKAVKEDAIRVRKIFRSLGIKDEDTTFHWNVSYQNLDKLVTELKLKYIAAQEDGVNTLFVIWYGGHGVMLNTTTQVVVNDSDPKRRCYPLELNLNHFSNFKHSYTVVILDCCRTLFKQYGTGAGRGDGPEDKLAASLGQIKFVFACQPGDATPA